MMPIKPIHPWTMPIKSNVQKRGKQLRCLDHLTLPEPIGGQEDSSGVLTVPQPIKNRKAKEKLNQELIVKH